MANFTIYHNPRCSKSRQTLELLQEKGADVTIVEYLKTPPNQAELKRILKLLGVKPQQLMRDKEEEYHLAGLDNTNLSEAEQIALMVAHPKVIERPIVVLGDRAVVGRPPENVLDLFD